MNRWYVGLLEGVERMLTDVTLPDEELAMGSAWRPFTLAWLLADRGALDEAQGWATRLVDAGRSRRIPFDEGRGRWALAEVLRRSGELEAADAEIQAGLALLRMACPLDMPGALATLAALRLTQGRAAEGLAAAEEGLARYEAMGACGFFRGAFLRLVHAECLFSMESHEAARTAILAARQKLLVNADKIDNPEHKKAFLESVPENARTLELARRWLGEDAAPAIGSSA
jgi:hypothetical protein